MSSLIDLESSIKIHLDKLFERENNINRVYVFVHSKRSYEIYIFLNTEEDKLHFSESFNEIIIGSSTKDFIKEQKGYSISWLKVDVIIDTHENVLKNFEGNYRYRLS